MFLRKSTLDNKYTISFTGNNFSISEYVQKYVTPRKDWKTLPINGLEILIINSPIRKKLANDKLSNHFPEKSISRGFLEEAGLARRK